MHYVFMCFVVKDDAYVLYSTILRFVYLNFRYTGLWQTVVLLSKTTPKTFSPSPPIPPTRPSLF